MAGLPDPEPERRVVQRQRAPVRQAARTPAVRMPAVRAARAADWVAPAVLAGANGGEKAPVAAGWVKPVQGALLHVWTAPWVQGVCCMI